MKVVDESIDLSFEEKRSYCLGEKTLIGFVSVFFIFLRQCRASQSENENLKHLSWGPLSMCHDG